VIVVGCAAALVVALSGSGRSGRTISPVAATSPVASASRPTTPQDSRTPLPLELIALSHERDADRLTVRGVVRNPGAGAEVHRLTAVVFVFNHDGGFVASGRAAVDALPLVPGAEAPFAVTIAGAADVGRYRVSFRTDERVVPHVDRRDRAMAQLKQP